MHKLHSVHISFFCLASQVLKNIERQQLALQSYGAGCICEFVFCFIGVGSWRGVRVGIFFARTHYQEEWNKW